jgi:hypothetical protein
MQRSRLWKLPEPWTPRTRPPLLGHAQGVCHSYHKASFVNRVLPMLPVNSVTYLPGRSVPSVDQGTPKCLNRRL